MLKPSQVDRISIGKPCRASWEEMAGAGGERFCDSCQRVVHDLSKLTRREAAALVNRSADGLCARVSYDERGRVLFARDLKASGLGRLVQVSLLGVSALGSGAVLRAQAVGDSQVCQVTVRVFDVTGAPVSDARVSLGPAQGASEARAGVTDVTGIFHNTVAAGEHSLHVEATGFYPYSETQVKCHPGAAVRVDVTLRVGVWMGEVALVDTGHGPIAEIHKAWHRAKRAIRRTFRS